VAVERTELELVWPADLFRREGQALLDAGNEDESRLGWLLAEAFHGDRGYQLFTQTPASLQGWGDVRPIGAPAASPPHGPSPRAQLVVELVRDTDQLLRYLPRQYYSARRNPRPEATPRTLAQTKTAYARVVVDLSRTGYLKKETTVFCENCGSKASEDDRFCRACGEAQRPNPASKPIAVPVLKEPKTPAEQSVAVDLANSAPPVGRTVPVMQSDTALAERKRWRTPMLWAILPLPIVVAVLAGFYLSKGPEGQGIPRVATSTSSTAPIRPATQASTTTPTKDMAPTKPPAAPVPVETPTDVQITHWGAPDSPPVNTVTLAQDGRGCTSSDIGFRQDALRCFTTSPNGGSWVLDPCFELDSQEGLMCPTAPWSSEWTLISAQGNTGDVAPPTTQGRPWGVEIASGIRCLEESGAVDEVSGIPHSYSCTDGSGLYGDPSRGTTWHIELSPKASNGSLRSVALIGAWY
jgi:hypothetical protein